MIQESKRPKVLIVEDDSELATQLKWALAREYDVVIATDGPSALRTQRRDRTPVVTLDLGLPPDPGGVEEGFKLLAAFLERDPFIKVIVITGREEREHGLRAVSMGAYDYMTKPVEVEELKVVLKRAFHLRNLEEEHKALEAKTEGAQEIIFGSPVMDEVWAKIHRLAKTDVPVLITGETGTGKELTARAIHRLSRRKDGPFVPIDCASIPETLLEAELFGHEKGAFTGAHTRRQGKVESAHGGTLFLDEVGDLALSLQAKLLRFLQEHQFQRVGGREWIRVDARILAATNTDLKGAMEKGAFREDLYHRLSVVVIELPPLREREGDVSLLAKAFLDRFAAEAGRRLRGFTSEALRAMEAYPWPGNVRELENRVRRAVIMAKGARITVEDLGIPATTHLPEDMDLKSAREDLERKMVEKALRRFRGNMTRAAQALGITRPTLYDLMERLGIKERAGRGDGSSSEDDGLSQR
jgi:two-component system NtrC family response regulator